MTNLRGMIFLLSLFLTSNGVFFIWEYFNRRESKLSWKQYMQKNNITFSEIFILISLGGGIIGFCYQFLHLFSAGLPFSPYFDVSALFNDSIIIVCHFTIALIIFILISYRGYEPLKRKFAYQPKKKTEKLVATFLWLLASLLLFVFLSLRQQEAKIQIKDEGMYSIYYMNNRYIMYYTGDEVNTHTLLIRDRESDIIKNALFIP